MVSTAIDEYFHCLTPFCVSRGSATLAVPRQDKEDGAVPDKLNDFALNEAALPVQIFGMELVSLLLLCAIPCMGNIAPLYTVITNISHCFHHTGGVCVCEAVCSPGEGLARTLHCTCCSVCRVTKERCNCHDQSHSHLAKTAACGQNGCCECSLYTSAPSSWQLQQWAVLSVLSTAGGGCYSSHPLGACPQGHPPTDIGWFGSMVTDTCTPSATSH